ncbi:hypothetical protein Bhyg_04574 [Pseudolycoriella hygida]|uniref:Uncharacterized protein n=1 Tax=Pseudolycoriella hygida TaxID=35572 RepID=A0A9Q0SA55_9DIPT|nr:hypothetical protein Bhyg_04574 [Pseudolycoriella hygida]
MQPVYEAPDENEPDQSINKNAGLTKLLENTQNLVTNKDVIDINEAVEHTSKPLFIPTVDDQYDAASNGQKHALEHDRQQQLSQDLNQSDKFISPIVVADENYINDKPTELVNIVPYVEYLPQRPKQRPEKQINVEIIDSNNGQFLKETTRYETHSEVDQKLVDSIVLPQKEAPSRQFLRNFKGNKILSPNPENSAFYSTTSSTTQTTAMSITQEELTVTESPVSNDFLAPIQAGLTLSNEGKPIDDCLDLVQKEPVDNHAGILDGRQTLVEVQKSLNIKNILISQEEQKPIPQVFGARFVPKKEKIIHQNVYIDRPYPVEVKKYIEKPVRVEVPVHVDRIVEKPVPYPVPVEKVVEKPVERIVEKTVQGPVQKIFIEKIVEKPIHHTHYQPYQVTKTERIPVPYVVEKIIDRPVPVEKIVEKIIDRPVEVEKIVERPYKEVVEKIVDRPYPVEVEKIVEKEVKVEVPVEKVVEKIIDRPVPVEVPVDRPYPVTVEKIVEKFVDRPVPYAVHVPYPVPYAVHVAPPKQHHTIIKTTTHEHGKNLFNFNHKNTKHVFIPNPPINQHFSSNLIQSPETPPTKQHLHLAPISHHHESTVLKPIHTISNQLSPPMLYYTNLKPKPVYGVPFFGHSTKTTHLFPKHLNYDNQYAGSFDYQSHIYKDDYLGPPPLQHQTHLWLRQTPKYRRNINFAKSLRWEYGFRPPLIPSVEIDEHGNPINKENN